MQFLYSVQFYEILFILTVGFLLYTYFFANINNDTRKSYMERENSVFRGYKADPPEYWKCKFKNALGKYQSPINLIKEETMILKAEKPLQFNHQFYSLPKSMTLLNDGFGVLLGTCFEKEYPTISGGPLKAPYRFNLAQFKWGPTDREGSEHFLNSERYAMEMQLMHIKGEQVYDNLDAAVQQGAVLFISFLFAVTSGDNPFLSAMVEKLHCIRMPNTSYALDPFPLCWLFQPFRSNYFFYRGSITCPPCTEGADWLVQSEPLSISNNQLQAFRSLMAVDGPMQRNTRPVQKQYRRTVFYYS